MAEAQLTARIETKGAKKAAKELDNFAKEAKQAEGNTEKLKKSLKAAPKALAAITAAGAAAAGAILIVARNSAQAQKEIAALARVAGVTAEEFQALAFATDTVGISGEKLSDISKDVNEKLGEFVATGGGGFKDFFEEVAPIVGVTAEELQNLSGPQVLQRVKNAMDQANISMEEQSFFLESIASDTTLLIPLLENEGEALETLTKRYKETAGAIQLTATETEALTELSNNFTLLGEESEKASAKITATLAPTLNDFLNSVIDQAPKATEAIVNFINSIVDPKNITELTAVNKEIGETAEQIQFLRERLKTGETEGFFASLFSSKEADKRFLQEAEQRLTGLIERSNELRANIAGVDETPPTKTKKPQKSKTIDIDLEKAAEAAAEANARALDSARQTAEGFLAEINKMSAGPMELIRLQENEQLSELQSFFDQGLIGWQDYYTARDQIITEAEERRKEIANQTVMNQLQAGQQLFSGLAELQATFGDDQGKTYKALFAVQKAFSIAQAVLNLSTAASQAATDPTAVTPAQKFLNISIVTSEMLALVSSIKSAKFDARAQGGQFSQGQNLLVGEKGPELVSFNSGGRIASAEQTNALMNKPASVTIINQTTGRIDKTETREDSDGNTVIIVQEVLKREVLNPNSQFNKNLDKTRKIQRQF